MKNTGFLQFALVASLILNVTFVGSAGYVAYRRHFAWLPPISETIPRDRFLFDELALRPGQRKALQENAIPFRTGLDRCRREVVTARNELLALIKKDKTDRKAIDAVLARISVRQLEMQHRITDHLIAEKALLDPEQQRKFLDLIEKGLTGCGHGECIPEERR
jgi:Spy/CpxP family protein refolding chaperone